MNNEYHRNYNLNRYHQIRNRAIQEKGGKCIDCGTENNLEFDHLDPTYKCFSIGRLLNVSLNTLKIELEKCILRCTTCHQHKTSSNGDNNKVAHGQGKTGKRNCYCNLCAPLKREYMKQYRLNKNKPS